MVSVAFTSHLFLGCRLIYAWQRSFEMRFMSLRAGQSYAQPYPWNADYVLRHVSLSKLAA